MDYMLKKRPGEIDVVLPKQWQSLWPQFAVCWENNHERG